MNNNNIQSKSNIPELQSPFEQLRTVDSDGKEWWNSRKLARVMGYGKYWNFERVMAKAQAWVTQKGYHLGEHFVEYTEMAELGNGGVREVISIKRSRAACMAIAMNADQKKDMVKVAQEYFSATMTSDVAWNRQFFSTMENAERLRCKWSLIPIHFGYLNREWQNCLV